MADLVTSVCREIVQRRQGRADHTRPFVTAITGPDTAGKSHFAAAMQESLARLGYETELICVDDFHFPRATRYDTSLSEPEAYLQCSIDFDSLIADLLRPITENHSVDLVRNGLDLETDTYARPERYRVRPDTIVLVEGVFLLRADVSMYFDYTVCLWVDSATMLHRGFGRDFPSQGRDVMRKYDSKYIPAQRLHQLASPPRSGSDIVVDTVRWRTPTVVPCLADVSKLADTLRPARVVFDLWDTLIRLDPWARLEAFHAVCDELDMDPRILSPLWQGTRCDRETMPLDRYLERLGVRAERNWSALALTRAMERRRSVHDSQFARDAPRVRRILTRLRATGPACALLSNCTSDVREMLDRHELSPLFDVIALSAETGLLKPDPRAFARVQTSFGIREATIVFVGDGANGELVGALLAGWHPIRLGVDDGTEWVGSSIESLELLVQGLCARPQEGLA